MAARDEFNLERFVDAQASSYDQVCQELRAGHKQSHWIWFIFPQMRGLGHSELAHHFGIASRQEAEAYLAHPVLGARLRECTGLVNEVVGRTVDQIFGYPDNLKFHSSISLFASVAPEEPVFQQALQKYFGGELDPNTVALLR
jgi:uncharacterized protein (DUF1810 family)